VSIQVTAVDAVFLASVVEHVARQVDRCVLEIVGHVSIHAMLFVVFVHTGSII